MASCKNNPLVKSLTRPRIQADVQLQSSAGYSIHLPEDAIPNKLT